MIFDTYPRKRIELPNGYKAIYNQHIKANRNGATKATTVSQKMELWMHKKVAEDTEKQINSNTLEIGAGTLNHLLYEKYKAFDIVEPFAELYEQSGIKNKIRNIYSDISEISPVKQYDRIISIATFEHILDLPGVIAQTCNLLNDNGELRIAIPNTGTVLWTLGWMLTTGIEFRVMHGLKYRLIMKYEHVNYAREIEWLLKYFYNDVKTSVYGISRGLGFYRFFRCRLPNTKNLDIFVKQN